MLYKPLWKVPAHVCGDKLLGLSVGHSLEVFRGDIVL